MTNDDICGAEKTNGEVCTFSPKHPDGKCGHHTDTGENAEQGRPTKLSKQKVDQITANIAEGKSDASAFRLADLDPKTKYNWLDKVDPEDAPEDPEFETHPYAYFFRRYTHARGLGEDYYFKTVVEMAKEEGDHRFLAGLMKQRYPDSWGETETGVDAETTVINVPDSVAQEWERKPQR